MARRSEDQSSEKQLDTADIAASSDVEDDDQPLLPADRSDEFVVRWERIQTRFVDEPRTAVEEADHLVAEIMQVLAHGFSEERTNLEGQWDQGDDVSTEDLRIALQRYRSFFQRLLAA